MPGIKAKRKQLVRKTLMRAKAQSERAAEQRQESPEEYAQTEVQQGISDVAARTGNTAKSTARMSYRKFCAMQEKRKNLTLQGSAQSASKPTEKEKMCIRDRLWGLVTTGPQTFKGGAVWSVMQTLHNGMVGIGYAPVSYTHLDVYKRQPLDIDPRPSVRATIMALKKAARTAAQAQEKVQDITAKEER